MDALKEKLANYREVFKFLLLMNLAVVSGAVSIMYKFLNDETNLSSLVFAYIGLFLSIVLSLFLKFIWNKMNEIVKDMNEL